MSIFGSINVYNVCVQPIYQFNSTSNYLWYCLLVYNSFKFACMVFPIDPLIFLSKSSLFENCIYKIFFFVYSPFKLSFVSTTAFGLFFLSLWYTPFPPFNVHALHLWTHSVCVVSQTIWPFAPVSPHSPLPAPASSHLVLLVYTVLNEKVH